MSKVIENVEGSVVDKEIVKDYSYKLSFMQKVYSGIKTVFDFFVALIGLIVLTPAFIVVGILIKLDSKGPVFFTHKRIGKNNKEFYCIKFRSMATNARHDIAGYEYADVTSYITKVGKFIRKTSIDELPQLINVLCGKMSLVGYRPSQRSEKTLNDARESVGLYQIKPGITGWAQVNGRDELAAKPVEKAKYDAYYLRKYSLWLDIKILFMTVKQVIFGSGVVEGKIENTDKAGE